jgi:hypothetical protein
VWGADSYEWRPERWLEADQDPESPIGVYGNLYVAFIRPPGHGCVEMDGGPKARREFHVSDHTR